MDLYKVCSNYGPGVKIGPAQGAHMFYIEIYRKNFKKSSANLQFKPVERIQALLGLLLYVTLVVLRSIFGNTVVT